jgi:aminopeptidase N
MPVLYSFSRMKKIFASCLVVLHVLAHAQWTTEQIAASEQKGVLLANPGERSGAIDNTKITAVRLELQVDPAVNYIKGAVTTTFIPTSDISLIQFDLTDSLTVDSVKFHGAKLVFNRPGNEVIDIPLPITIANQQTDSISVYYEGVPDKSGFGSFTQSYHDSVPIIWTLSEPYGAKDWWPCKQNLSDKIDSLDVIVTTPAAYRVASNGLLVNETQAGNNKIYHWKHRYPIATYLVCLAVTNYAVYTDYVPFKGDTLTVLNYVYPEDTLVAMASSAQLISFMQLYDSLLGLYPFSKEKYGQAEFGWGGGMEHQTMTFVTDFGFDLLSHELAHHWFGDKVTCASWQDIWLNEGFATYLNGLCYQYVSPYWWPFFKQGKISHITSKPDGSVFCRDTSTVARIFDGRLTYSKGCMVLHQLRWMIGDSAFFSGLRSYLNDVTNAYAFATTASLKSHLENSSGKDLTQYFNNWIYAEGFPSYQFKWSQDFDRHILINVTQTQSHSSVAYFPMLLPVVLKSGNRDTLLVLNNSGNGQSYEFDLPFFADTLLFDPEQWLISANNTVNRLSAYNFSIFVYPNPVNTQLQMQVEAVEEKEAEVRIFSSNGQIMWKGSYKFPAGASMVTISTANLAAGLYGLKVETAEKIISASFLKSNR